MSQAQCTVLVVDDSPEDRELYRRLLLKTDACTYRILEADTGQDGLTIWQQQQPDVLLLDYRLPDLDGLEFLAQLRGSMPQPCLPVVMLTGLGSEEIAVKAIKAGAHDYLVKGQITPESLHHAIQGAIASVQLYTELHQRIERERVISQITRQIHHSLDLHEVLNTTVEKVRRFLQTDRVLILRIQPDSSSIVLTESVGAEWIPLLSTSYRDDCLNTAYMEPFRQGLVIVKPDIYDGTIQPCHVELLENLQVRANLVVPILQDQQLWGLIIAHHCAAPRQWQALEIELLQELATQVGIAVQQSELYQQARNELAERQRTETALRKSEEYFRQLTENIDAVFWVTELPGRKVAYVSPAYERLWGLSRQDIYDTSQTWINLIHPDDREAVEQAFQEQGLKGKFDQEYRIVLPNGAVRWVRDRCFPLFDASGTPYRLTGIAEDITASKQIAAEREQLLQETQSAWKEAKTANRLKDEFLAVLSHELRSPLNPILGWTKLLQNRPFDPLRAKEALAVIERNAKLQAQLIDDLLDVSRIINGKMNLNCEPVNLPFIISSALETVRLSAEAKQIQIKTLVESGVETILGDPARLQQVVWNLLSNAIKFTPPGGQVVIQLGKAGSPKDSSVQLTVTDTGRGIKPEFLPHLFEYFRQEDASTTRRFGGLGLGLAIIRQIVELHGGTVSADSPGENQGATFTVKLPLPNQQRFHPLPAPASLSSDDASSPLTGVHVLVVDDDSDTLSFYQVVLEASGATVTIANSAAIAMQHLLHYTPDVLVSDIGMPDTNGYMLLQQVKSLPTESGKPIPAIAISAYASDSDRKQSLAAGFQMHLSKPIDSDALVRAIEQARPSQPDKK